MKKILLFLIVLNSILFEIYAKDEFYKTLGVKKRATEAEIKSSYRKLAKKWHPDRHREEKKKNIAQKKFMKISEAYETLSDPKLRKEYDEIDQGQQSNSNTRHHNFQQSGPGGFSFGNSQQNPEDLFSAFASMFGGRGQNRNHGSHQRRQRNTKFQVDVGAQLRQVFQSSSVEILSGENIKETIGKSFRGNNIWLTLFVFDELKEDISKSIVSLSEKFSGLLYFAVIDCTKQDKAFCEKQVNGERNGIFIKEYSSYKNNNLVKCNSIKDQNNFIKLVLDNLPTPNILKVDKKSLLQSIRKCMKTKSNVLGCVYVFTDKIDKTSNISWKLQGIAHKLKDKAELIIISVDKANKSLVKTILHSDTLPVAAVYKNTQSNKVDIRLEKLITQQLHGSSFLYLSDALTKEVWARKS